MQELAETISFQRFQLDYRRRLLRADGAAVPLHSRTFDMLVLLIAERDRVLSRDEIIAHVWAGLAVGENNLTVQMSSLRKTLAEHGGEGLIITVPGRGYRFVGDIAAALEAQSPLQTPGLPAPPRLVEPEPASIPVPVAPPARRRSHPLAAALVGMVAAAALYLGAQLFWRTPAPPRLSIAVLPFRDLSDGATHGYMADAITDDLTTDLAHIPGSIVIARESTDLYRDKPAPAPQIGRALNVRYLLEGSIRAQADRLHIDAQLIGTAGARQLWSEQFDAPSTGLAETQSTIVRRIASALDTRLTEIEGALAQHDRPHDSDAQSLFLRARLVLERDDTLDSFATAQGLLEQAVRMQPDYTDALAELGLALLQKSRSLDDPTGPADLAEAHSVIGHALQLPGQNPIALAADARLHESDGDCMGATASATLALKLEPNSIDALALLAKCAANAGQLEQAKSYEQALLQMNPASGRSRPRFLLLSQIDLLEGHYQEAIGLAYQALQGDGPPQPGTHCMDRQEYGRLLLIAARQLNGEGEQARALYREYATFWPNRSVWRVAAFSSKGTTNLPEYKRFEEGLIGAGMPLYANEHDPAASRATTRCAFDPPPPLPKGVRALDTATLVALRQTAPLVLIDVGQGAAVPKGAFWVADKSQDASLASWLASQIEPLKHDAPIVIFGSGLFGRTASDAAGALLAAGYRNIYLYKGGEEAWNAAGLPATDRRWD